MSTYSKITRHPLTGKYEKASYMDDYFGPHMYGVKFSSDPVIYPADQVVKSQLKEFWAEDVINATRVFVESDIDRSYTPSQAVDMVLLFLSRLQESYDLRWKNDPTGGEGAVDTLREKKGTKA